MKLALRIDDIGASSKQFEVYSKRPGGNFLFLKYLPGFRAWGQYKELDVGQWEKVFDVLAEYKAKLTVAVTACWVEKDGQLVPYPRKFPQQAAMLKKAVGDEVIEIANHGLTHCVAGRHLPRLFSSNRKFHREFWDWLDEKKHYEHMEKSQNILQDYFQVKITTLVPPGNVFSEATIDAAAKNGICCINCQTDKTHGSMKIIGNKDIFAFHDRELVLYGIDWLRRQLVKNKSAEYVFVREL